MRPLVLLALCFAACAAPYGSAYAPRSNVELLPHEATYEILGRVSATVCGAPDFIAQHINRSTDKWHGDNRYLYELAKVQALDSKPESDQLLFIRSIEKVKDGQFCVTVNGLAVKVTSLKAGAATAMATPVTSPLAPKRGNSLLMSPTE